MIILAAIFMFLVITLSFRPISPEKMMTAKLNFLNFAFKNNSEFGNPQFYVENFVQTNAPEEYWKGDYKFEYVVQCPDAKSLEKARNDRLPFPTNPDTIAAFVTKEGELKNIETRVVEGGPETEYRVEVISTGTTAEGPQAWTCASFGFLCVGTRLPALLGVTTRSNLSHREDHDE